MIQIEYGLIFNLSNISHPTDTVLIVLARKAVQHAVKEAIDLTRPLIVDQLNAFFQTTHFCFARLDVTEDERDGVRIQYALECPDGLALTGGTKLLVNAAHLAIMKVMESLNCCIRSNAEQHLCEASDIPCRLEGFKAVDNNKTPDEPTQALQIKAYKEGLQVTYEEFLVKKGAHKKGITKAREAGSIYQSMAQSPPPDGLLPDVSSKRG